MLLYTYAYEWIFFSHAVYIRIMVCIQRYLYSKQFILFFALILLWIFKSKTNASSFSDSSWYSLKIEIVLILMSNKLTLSFLLWIVNCGILLVFLYSYYLYSKLKLIRYTLRRALSYMQLTMFVIFIHKFVIFPWMIELKTIA